MLRSLPSCTIPFLEDLDSTNGLEVNGKPTKKHFLQNNDVIEIGKYKLKYINDQITQTSPADFEKTMILRAPAKQATPAPGANKPAEMHGFMQTQAGSKPTHEEAVERTGKFEAHQPTVPAAPAQAAAPAKPAQQQASCFCFCGCSAGWCSKTGRCGASFDWA